MPVVEKRRMLPDSSNFQFLALDEDGFEVPSDWFVNHLLFLLLIGSRYMRVCGFAAEALRGERLIHETFPAKELQDYWATRPKYEDAQATYAASSSTSAASGSGSSLAASGYQAWLAAQKNEDKELPPPPYSLEAEEPSPSQQHTASDSGSTVPSPNLDRPSLSSQSSHTSVASLATDFARQRLSERSGASVPPASPTHGISPPLPPRNAHGTSRPVASMSAPPQQQGPPSRPRFDSRPAGPGAGPPTGLTNSTSQWPPPEWKTGRPTNPPYRPYQTHAAEPQNWSYPGQGGVASSSLMPQADVHPPFRPASAIQSQTPFPNQASSSPAPYSVPFPSNPEQPAQYGGPSTQPAESFYFRPSITTTQSGPVYASPYATPPVGSYEPNTEYNTPPTFPQFPERRPEDSSGPEYRPPMSTSPRPPQHPGMYSASQPYSETSAFGFIPNPQPGPIFSGNGPPPMMPPPRECHLNFQSLDDVLLRTSHNASLPIPLISTYLLFSSRLRIPRFYACCGQNCRQKSERTAGKQ